MPSWELWRSTGWRNPVVEMEGDMGVVDAEFKCRD